MASYNDVELDEKDRKFLKDLEEICGRPIPESAISAMTFGFKVKKNRIIGLSLSMLGFISSDKKGLNKFANMLDSYKAGSADITDLTAKLPTFTGFTTLPESITNLTALEDLILLDNKISELPESLKELKNLEVLNLVANPISIIPDFIGELTSLTELNLSGTKIETLPSAIGQLKSLSRLNLKVTGLKELPEELKELTNLSELKIYKETNKKFPKTSKKVLKHLKKNKCKIIID